MASNARLKRRLVNPLALHDGRTRRSEGAVPMHIGRFGPNGWTDEWIDAGLDELGPGGP